MALAVDRTKNIRCSCSNTFNCTLVLTRPWRTVALSRSSHLCKESSLSSTGTPWTTSRGPQSMNSRTDFAWLRDTARSSYSISFSKGVSFSPGRRISVALIAHLHRELRPPSSVDLLLHSSLNLEWRTKNILIFIICLMKVPNKCRQTVLQFGRHKTVTYVIWVKIN